jgi:hypothetical protein
MAVFSLNEVKVEQVKNIENNNFTSWPESATYGYFGGGYTGPPGISCTINRLDFFNETLSAPGINLPSAISRGATATSNLYGYFGGGSFGSAGVSIVTRLDFSNETVSSPGKNLFLGSRLLGGVSSISYGYFMGGFTPGYDSTMQRLDFSSENVSNPGKPLPFGRAGIATVSNNLYGYIAGGATTSLIERLDFSTENITTPVNRLPNTRNDFGGVSSKLYGYFGGGYSWPPALAYNTITRLQFDTETISNNPSTLAGISRAAPKTVNTDSYGYFAGGFFSPPYSYVSTITRLDFGTGSTTNLANNLPQNNNGLYSMSGGTSFYRGSKTFGYFAGGSDPVPSQISTINRLDFSNETLSDPGKNLLVNCANSATVASNNYGYICGGNRPSLFTSVVQRLDFVNETVNITGKNLPMQTGNVAGTSSSSYGYMIGGYTGTSPGPGVFFTTLIRRIDFSTENVSLPGKNLPGVRYSVATVANTSYSYICGGDIPTGRTSNVFRLDFSNETISSPGKNLPLAATGQGAVSTNLYGYIAGGFSPPMSTITRLDFSTENLSLPGKNFTIPRSNIRGTLSSYYGYFGGGANPPSAPTVLSTITRLDFATENLNDLANNFSVAKSSVNSLANSNAH